MTANATVTSARITSSDRLFGDIAGIPAIDYGNNGPLVPETFELLVTTASTYKNGKREDEIKFSLTLKSPNSSGNIQDAIFNYPDPSPMGRHNDGWGFAGHLNDAPLAAIEAVSAATGVNLVKYFAG